MSDVAASDAERIVRALAATDPYVEAGTECQLCEGGSLSKRMHKPDCPWLLATEWVKSETVA